MKHFYIVVNTIKDIDFRVADEIVTLIETLGGSAFYRREGAPTKEELEQVECIITLGGDGTLIQAAHKLVDYRIPFVGINIGTLGYLTEIEYDSINEEIEKLVCETPYIEHRMVLNGQVDGSDLEIALNDIVVTRDGPLRIMKFSIYVNGEYLHSYRGDGIIISTPTGSTGYNMSAGGPIVEPTASAIVLTPICSHSLDNRSIVLSAEDIIEVEVENERGEESRALISYDGGTDYYLETGKRVKIIRSQQSVQLVKLSSVSFLETLRRKMKGFS